MQKQNLAETTTNEIMRSFLAANQAKKVGYINDEIKPTDFFNNMNTLFSNKTARELKDLIKDKHRLERFLNHRWHLRKVELKYVGGWPKIGDLHKEWCVGSVVDVANQVKQHMDENLDSINTIKSMKNSIDDILKFFPPILISGGEIRTKTDLMHMPFDSDDGSHRCVTAALEEKTSIAAYVGLP